MTLNFGVELWKEGFKEILDSVYLDKLIIKTRSLGG